MRPRDGVEATLLIAIGGTIGLAVMGIASVNGADIEWETLSTGIAAVAAAVFTVRQMRASDKGAALRHERVVALQYRADWLKVQRAAMDGALLLAAVNSSARARRPIEDHFVVKTAPNRAEVLDFERAVAQLIDRATASSFKECMPLLGAAAAKRQAALSKSVTQLSGYFRQFVGYLSTTQDPAPPSVVVPVLEDAGALEDIAILAADDLLRLRDRYAVFALPDLDDNADIWNGKSLVPRGPLP